MRNFSTGILAIAQLLTTGGLSAVEGPPREFHWPSVTSKSVGDPDAAGTCDGYTGLVQPWDSIVVALGLGDEQFAAGPAEGRQVSGLIRPFGAGDIAKLRWWGTSMEPGGSSPGPFCAEDDAAGTPFRIRFYSDAGGQPGALVASRQTTSLSIVDTGAIWNGTHRVKQYSATVDPVDGTNVAYIGVQRLAGQNASNGQPCVSYWAGTYAVYDDRSWFLSTSISLWNHDLSLCVGHGATAAPPIVSPEVPVSVQGGEPAVATDRVGRRVVAWHESGADGSGLGVLAQLYDSSGVKIGSTIHVNVASSGNQGNAAVAFDPAGNFVVAWEKLTYHGVFARRFDSHGVATTGDIALDGGTGGQPSVGLSASGEAVVVFERGSGGGVAARRIAANGTLLGPAIQIESQQQTGRAPRVVRHASGKFVAVWERPAATSSGEPSGGGAEASAGGRIAMGWFGDEGAPESGDVEVDPGPNTLPSAPDLGGDAGEHVWVAWREEPWSDVAGGTRISARKYDPSGEPDGPEVTVADPPPSTEVGDPSISTSPSGRFGVGWQQSSAAGDQVGAQLFDDTGDPTTEEVILPTQPGENQAAPTVALDDSGRMSVGYQKQGSLQGVATREVRAFTAGCVAGDTTLCLNGSRFKVEVFWRDFAGNSGVGRTRTLTGDTGAFWFFGPANLELVIKVLDARWSGYWWVYFGALSDVEYTLVVTDTQTGYSKTYFNPAGNLASRADTNAIPAGTRVGVAPASAYEELGRGETGAWDELDWVGVPLVEREVSGELVEKATCSATPARLCLQSGRFSLTVSWRDHQGNTGTGTGVVLTTDTGYFWFFNSANIELVVKVLDARWSGYWWLFYGALSDVEYTLTIKDEATGRTRTYFNPKGNLASRSDTQAFPAN